MQTEAGHGLSDQETARLGALRRVLDAAGARYEILSHQEMVASAADGAQLGWDLAEMAPTLILSSERGYIAAIISAATRLSYKKVKQALGLKNVSLAKPDVVLQVAGTPAGAVSLVNQGMPTIVDIQLTRLAMVYGGCGVPCHTLCISPLDLVRVTQAEVLDMAEARQPADA